MYSSIMFNKQDIINLGLISDEQIALIPLALEKFEQTGRRYMIKNSDVEEFINYNINSDIFSDDQMKELLEFAKLLVADNYS